MSALFWLSDRAWAAIEPILPRNQPCARRVDDRRVISGIIHVLRVGCRWQDCPPDYGPSTTICNRFNRWSHKGLWTRIFTTLSAPAELPGDLSIDSTAVRAHRSSHGAKGGRKVQAIGRSRGGPTTKIHALTDGCGRAMAFILSPGNCADISVAPALLDRIAPPTRLLADKGYDANSLRERLATSRTEAVIPSTRSRKVHIPFDETAYTSRNLIERAFCRLNDWRRIATRYDKLKTNFESAIAAIVRWRT
ncbi:IS5/IS1182 family transposase [Paracoccus zhejiangensis]|uniref:IS5/IS1182 family transposase n=1 Tax=Paracoccus zhejiangensis TaxID=1077935 RepID=A0A2H5F359_9RHOB|nr:IS5/IS1182 family transposase [Paracoccus zhejiangensis]